MSFERESFNRTIRNDAGDIVPNAQITVYSSSGGLAVIYASLTGAPKDNPFNTDAGGKAEFYAEPGRYDVHVFKGGNVAVLKDVDLSQKALRDDIGETLDSAETSSIAVSGIKALGSIPHGRRRENLRYNVYGFYAGNVNTIGEFRWVDSLPKSNHNGVTVIDPNKADAWNGESSGLESYFAPPTSGTGAFVRINYVRITPEMCGAVEGYDPFNHVALAHLMKQDWPVELGNKNYGVSEGIGDGTTKLGAIDWISSGCRIYVEEGSAPIYRIIYFNLLPLTHRIQGEIIVDGNMLANNGFQLDNPSGEYGTFISDGLHSRNIRRQAGLFATAGTLIRGAWHSVILDNPTTTNVLMPAGTGVPTQQGVAGIAVTPLNGEGPRYIKATNIRVEDIKSEDIEYTVDQDGISFFSELPGSSIQPRFDIEGGYMKDCWGRFIKAQIGGGTVRGVTVELFTSTAQGPIVFGSQRGCIDIYECVYNIHGDAVGGPILENRGDPSKRNTSFTAQSIDINNMSSVVLASAFQTSGNGPVHQANFNDIDIRGPVFIPFQIRTVTADTVVNISNFYADDITGNFIAEVRRQGTYVDPESPADGNTEIPFNFNNIVHKGDGDVYLLASAISGVGIRGVTNTSGKLDGITLLSNAQAGALSGTLSTEQGEVGALPSSTKSIESLKFGTDPIRDGSNRMMVNSYQITLPASGEITIPTDCLFPFAGLIEIFGYRGTYAKLVKVGSTLNELNTFNASVENEPGAPGSGRWVVRPGVGNQSVVVENRQSSDDQLSITVVAR